MDVLERLCRARTTATNDDMSEPRSENRRRHVDRIEAMYMATDEIERLRAEIIAWRENVVFEG